MSDDSVNLDLQEGFDDDVVLLHGGDDAPPWRLDGVSTRLQIGRARSQRLPGALQVLVVELPQRGLREEVVLLPGRPLWVGLSLSRDGGQLAVRQQHEPFGYA